MNFLIHYIVANAWKLGSAVRKCPVAVLPGKMEFWEAVRFNEVIRARLNLFYQIWKWLGWFVSNKNMNVIWHRINGQHFMTSILDNTCNVCMEFFFPGGMDECLAVFYCEYEMYVYLGVCVCHGSFLKWNNIFTSGIWGCYGALHLVCHGNSRFTDRTPRCGWVPTPSKEVEKHVIIFTLFAPKKPHSDVPSITWVIERYWGAAHRPLQRFQKSRLIQQNLTPP